MKKKVILAQLIADKGKYIRQISTGDFLGKEVLIHPMITPYSDYEEIEVDIPTNEFSNVLDLTEESDLDLEYVQSLVDNLGSGESILFAHEDALDFAAELILGEGMFWKDDKVVSK